MLERSTAVVDFRKAWRRHILLNLLWVSPLLAVMLGIKVPRAFEGAGLAEAAFALVMSLVVSWVIYVVVDRYQFRRATSIEGWIWISRRALYAGPLDDEGLPRAGEFAKRSLPSKAWASPVRLVLTKERFAIVAMEQKTEPLECPLDAVGRIDVISAGPLTSGLELHLRDGRRAWFLFRPGEELIDLLQSVGGRAAE